MWVGVCGGRGGRGRMEGGCWWANVKVALTRGADQWKQAGCPDPIPVLLLNIFEEQCATPLLRCATRCATLTEESEDEELLERAPLTAVVVALWRVWRWLQWQPAGWSGLWLAVPVAESVPPCQPAQRPPAGPGEGVAAPRLQGGEKLPPGRHWS